jgi:hypothetical protein
MYYYKRKGDNLQESFHEEISTAQEDLVGQIIIILDLYLRRKLLKFIYYFNVLTRSLAMLHSPL